MLDYYAVCSNPDCSFKKSNDDNAIRFCPLCGSKAITECPHCHMPINERGIFCIHCGKNLKEPVQQEGAE